MSFDSEKFDRIAQSDLHNARGIELADCGWLDESIKEFQKAIELSIVSIVFIVFVALATGSMSSAVLMLGWIIAVHVFEANLLNPKIMGDSAKIYPVIVVLALLAGEHLHGIPGALFAVPVTSIGITLFRSLQARVSGLERDRRAFWLRPAVRPPRAYRDPLF